MASPRDDLLRLNAQGVVGLGQLEEATARQIAAAYEESRRALLATIAQRQAKLMGEMPAETRAELQAEMARDRALFAQIDARLQALRRELQGIVSDSWERSLGDGMEQAKDEAQILRRGIGTGFSFRAIDFASVEVGLEDALRALDVDQARVAAVLRAELRAGLMRGDQFDDIIARLMGRDAGVWVNGRLSAERAARRGVIDANNGARDLYYRRWREQVPGLRKQAIATIGATTTDTCLHVHGQIRDIGEPYHLEGRKAFGSRWMYPQFHWGCRTSSVAYHADFEVGAALTTVEMKARAAMELGSRR